MHQVINEQLHQHLLYRKHAPFITSFFVSYSNIISLLNHTPLFGSIFQHTTTWCIHQIINEQLYPHSICIIDNFHFLSRCLILCLLVSISFPQHTSYYSLTFKICNKAVVAHQWINSMPIATPSPFIWSLL